MTASCFQNGRFPHIPTNQPNLQYLQKAIEPVAIIWSVSVCDVRRLIMQVECMQIQICLPFVCIVSFCRFQIVKRCIRSRVLAVTAVRFFYAATESRTTHSFGLAAANGTFQGFEMRLLARFRRMIAGNKCATSIEFLIAFQTFLSARGVCLVGG